MASYPNTPDVRAFCRIREDNRPESLGSGWIVKTKDLGSFDQSSHFFLVTTSDVLGLELIKNTLKRTRGANYTIYVDIGSTESKYGTTSTLELREILLAYNPPGGEHAIDEVVKEISGLLFISLGKFQEISPLGTTTCTLCEKPPKLIGLNKSPSDFKKATLICHVLQEAKPCEGVQPFAPLSLKLVPQDTHSLPLCTLVKDSREISSKGQFDPHENPLGAMVTDGKGRVVGSLLNCRSKELRFLPFDVNRKTSSENTWVQEKESSLHGLTTPMVTGYNISPPVSSAPSSSSSSSPMLKRVAADTEPPSSTCNGETAKERVSDKKEQELCGVKAGDLTRRLLDKGGEEEEISITSLQPCKEDEISTSLQQAGVTDDKERAVVQADKITLSRVTDEIGEVDGAVGGELPESPINTNPSARVIPSTDSGVSGMESEYILPSGLDIRHPGTKPKVPYLGTKSKVPCPGTNPKVPCPGTEPSMCPDTEPSMCPGTESKVCPGNEPSVCPEEKADAKENDEDSDTNSTPLDINPTPQDTHLAPQDTLSRPDQDTYSTWSPSRVNLPPLACPTGKQPLPPQGAQIPHSRSLSQLDRMQPFKIKTTDDVCLLWDVSTNFQSRHFSSRLSRLLDSEYTYNKIECWRQLAKGMAIPAEDYERFGRTSRQSKSERLLEHLERTQPCLTVKELEKALDVIGNQAAIGILCRSDQGTVANMLNNERAVVGDLCVALDGAPMGKGWKELALQLKTGRRDVRHISLPANYVSPTAELFELIPVRKPRLTVKELRKVLGDMKKDNLVQILKDLKDSLLIKYLIDKFDIMNDLEEDLDAGAWKILGESLGIKDDDISNIKPIEQPMKGPTQNLFEYVKCSMPGKFHVKQLIILLEQMGRQDCLELIAEHLAGGKAAVDKLLKQVIVPRS